MRIWITLLVIMGMMSSAHADPRESFGSWLEDFKTEARMAGITDAVLADAFSMMEAPDPSIVKRDRTQPEKTKLFSEYLRGAVNERKVMRAKEYWGQHGELLRRVESVYGVPIPVMLALWGTESDFGNQQGNEVIVESLATLAFDGRRSAFFRKQLLAALQIIQEQEMEAVNLVGSWAGAMGQVQFMPTSYQAFAVDFDGDGKKDIWNSEADAIASMANYLKTKGWDNTLIWGMEVKLPDARVDYWKNDKEGRTVAQWRALGLNVVAGHRFPADEVTMRLVIPDNDVVKAYLVTSNYDVIMDWNRSVYFATSIGLLANAIAGL